MRIGTLSILSLVALSIGALGACGDAPTAEDLSEITVDSPIVGGVTASAYPEAALVDMYIGGRRSYICSGSLIAPKVVLTAGHCVEGIDSWKVTLPFAQNQSANGSTSAVYDWNNPGSETVNPDQHDIGLVFLDQALTLATYPTIATSKLADGSKAMNIGRIQDGRASSTQLFVGAPVTLRDATSSGFRFDYISSEIIQSGDSGGPVEVTSGGTHTVVAVNSGAGGGTQVLARTDLLASWIAGQIAAHGGGGGGGTTGGGTTGGGTTGGGTSGGGTTGGGTTTGGGGDCAGGAGEAEPNDGYTTPNAIAGARCGKIGPVGDDQDWYSWSVAAAGVAYSIKLETSGDGQLQMWKNVGGSWSRVANTTATEITHTSSGAGTYVFVVWSPSATGQSYTVTLAK